MIVFDLRDFIKQMVCLDDMEDCFIGECEQCSIRSIVSILTNEINVVFDDSCSWAIWKKFNNKFHLQQMTGSTEALLDEKEEQRSSFCFPVHSVIEDNVNIFLNSVRNQLKLLLS